MNELLKADQTVTEGADPEATASLHDEIDRCFSARDTGGLVLALRPTITRWARKRILGRGLRFNHDILEELVQEGCAKLLQAVPAMFQREMAGTGHIVNSARKAVVAKFIEILDERPLMHLKHSMLKSRRKQRRAGTLQVPISAQRPSDMPERVDDHIPLSLYMPWEYRNDVSGGTSQESGQTEREGSRDHRNSVIDGRGPGAFSSPANPLDRDAGSGSSEEHWGLVYGICELALELADGTTRSAIELMLTGTWIEPRRRWEIPDVTTAAQKFEVNRRTLADRLNALAIPIATVAAIVTNDSEWSAADPSSLKLARFSEYSEKSPAKIQKVPINTDRGANLGRISVRLKPAA